jgi:hypothetical protein
MQGSGVQVMEDYIVSGNDNAYEHRPPAMQRIRASLIEPRAFLS